MGLRSGAVGGPQVWSDMVMEISRPVLWTGAESCWNTYNLPFLRFYFENIKTFQLEASNFLQTLRTNELATFGNLAISKSLCFVCKVTFRALVISWVKSGSVTVQLIQKRHINRVFEHVLSCIFTFYYIGAKNNQHALMISSQIHSCCLGT